MTRPSWRAVVLPASLVVLGACRSIGPSTIPRDRLDYGAALTDSWKRQVLLNIVKLRYLDPPMFVDIGSIVSGYTLETSASAGGTLLSGVDGDSLSAGVAARFTDRPTVTYVPLTGRSFMGGIMTPMPPESLFFTIQAGWPADVLFHLGVAAINGHRNVDSSLEGRGEADPGFVRIAELMRRIQMSGAVSIRVIEDESKRQSAVMAFPSRVVPEATRADIVELRTLLGLNLEATEFDLVFGSAATSDLEVAVLTRSVLHVIQTLAMRVAVPESDVAEGRAVAGITSAGLDAERGDVLVRWSEADPGAEAFVTVRYRDRFFWIDDRDLHAKRDFAFIMLLFALANTGADTKLPVVTIPAQ